MSRWLVSLGPVLACFLVAGVAGMVITCGEADTAMPEPGPCPATSPTPTSRRDPLGWYRVTIQRNADRLYSLTSSFRAEYPDGKFYRSGEFRPDFARYADETVCIAQYLRGLALQPDFAAIETALDHVLDEFIAHQVAGREAVRARNVSEYRTWDRGIEAHLAALRRVGGVMP